MSNYQDTYFLNSEEALRVAKQNNKVKISSGVKGTQLCFYSGQKLESAPNNCINVPMEEISTYFATTPFRIPKNLDVSNMKLSDDETNQSLEAYKKLINLSQELAKVFILEEYEKIKVLEPDFTNDTLKVFMTSCRENNKTKKIFNKVEEVFKGFNLDVNHFTQSNDMESCNLLAALREQHRFNPHMIFNINFLDNHYLPENVYTFTLFTDLNSYMLEKQNIEKGNIRTIDYIYTVDEELHAYLNSKFITNTLVQLNNLKQYENLIKDCLEKILI